MQSNHSKSDKANLKLAGSIVLLAVVPAILFYLLEFYEHNPFVEVRHTAQLFNVLILELLGWGLFFVFRRACVSLPLLTVCTMIFGLINHYVMLFRSTPFVPWDVFSIRTAASVAGNYDFTPSARVIIVTLIFVAIFIGCGFCGFRIKKMRWYASLGSFVCIAVILGLFVNLLQDENFQLKSNLYPYLFTPAYMTQVDGMVVTFAMDLAYVAVDKPSGYNESKAEALLAEYESADSNDKGEELPNVIVIMDEAFSDLSLLSDYQTNEDEMPFVRSILAGEVENTVSGYLNVSVCGGNTANTEFEFLTGNTMAFLPAGSIPYQQYIKSEKMSLARQLANLGYETYGMHPYGASGWDRDTVYPMLGFEHTMFYNDFTMRQKVRNYVSDASDFAQIQSIYENKGDKPLFVFNVTMQNHGSYRDAYDNFTPNIDVEGTDSFSLEQYLSLVQLTDRSLQDLISYFSEQDEKTVIVFFGDHQPNDYTVNPVNGAKEEYLRYEVPYFIWANYDIGEATGKDTSANYLAANLMNILDLPTTDYQNFLLQLQADYPIISSARRVDSENADAEQINTYKKLQYYMLFDWEASE